MLRLSSVTNSSSSITLNWGDVSGEDGYKIYRSTSSASGYSQIASVGSNTTSYDDNVLSPATTYYYKVRAFNAGGNSGYSDYIAVSTYPDPPSTPVVVSAVTISNSSITFNWNDVSGEDGYKVYRSTNSASGYSQIASVGSNVTSYDDNGLNSATTYYYKVRAFNTGGNSGYSDYESAATYPDPPAAPATVSTVTNSSSSVTVNWSDVTGEDGFKVYRSTTSSSGYSQIASVSSNVTSYDDTGLSPSTTYYYKFMAFNAGGNSGYSDYSAARR